MGVYFYLFQSEALANERNELTIELTRILEAEHFEYSPITFNQGLKIRQLAYTNADIPHNITAQQIVSTLRNCGYEITHQSYSDNKLLNLDAENSNFILYITQK